ncbi:MAG: amidohydrolase family protein [Nanoarchaeota archaeon]
MSKVWVLIIIAVIITSGLFLYKNINSQEIQSDPIQNTKLENYTYEKPKVEEQSRKDFGQGWNKRIESALEPVDCITPEDRRFGDLYYSGDLIDTHYHIADIPDGDPNSNEEYSNEEEPVLGVNTKITDIVCTLDKEGTKKVFAFFPVYKEIPEQMVEVVRKTIEAYPDKFIPFIMTPDNDDSPDGFPTVEAGTLRSMLQIEPNLFKGYGEIGLYARGDHGGSKGSPELPPDNQRMLKIYPVVRENNLLVYVHLGEGQQESFERVLEQNPDINFIWHGDQLIKYKYGIQKLANIDKILINHPNAYYGVDELYGDTWLLKPETKKEDFLKHFNNYQNLLKEDIKTWKAFIEKHPDQVLWGTDRGWSTTWSVDEDVGITLTNYARAFIARLSPEVQEKFAYKNAEKLLIK